MTKLKLQKKRKVMLKTMEDWRILNNQIKNYNHNNNNKIR